MSGFRKRAEKLSSMLECHKGDLPEGLFKDLNEFLIDCSCLYEDGEKPEGEEK